MSYGGNVKMASSSNYRVKLRRRREGKTDYQARKALVVSGRPRVITRFSNKNATVQIAIAKPHGDMVLAAANSRELIKTYGWKASTGNIPAAYLTGLLCGLKAKAAGTTSAILDIGLIAPTKGSKIFAALSGVLDGGVEVPHSEEKIVKERMKGEHIAKYGKSLGAGSEEYTAKFSQYTAKSVAPEKIVEHFTKVKADIITVSKGGKIAPVEEAAAEPTPKAPKAKPVEKAAEKAVEKAAPKAAKPKAVKEKAPKAEAKAAVEAPKAPVAKAPKEKVAKEKAPKAKAPKAEAPKAKAPKEKTSKKVGKKE
jgi:large subunit ribosomal protein L18